MGTEGFPLTQWLRIHLQCLRPRFVPWVEKIPWRRVWQPTPVFNLENPMDRGAWWATVHWVTTSQTWLSDRTHLQGGENEFVSPGDHVLVTFLLPWVVTWVVLCLPNKGKGIPQGHLRINWRLTPRQLLKAQAAATGTLQRRQEEPPHVRGQGQKPGGPHAWRAVAKRSYPTSEVRGSGREYQTETAQERPRGATPRPRSGAAAERSYPTSEVRGGSREELPRVWGQGRQLGGATPHPRPRQRPEGATPCPRPGVAAGRSNCTSKEPWLHGRRRA